MKNNNSSQLSTLVNYQASDFIQEQHPVLLDFLEKYYYFLELSSMTLTGDNTFIIEEKYSQINRFVFEDGGYILDEQTTNDFLPGETIVGSLSKAKAKVELNDFNNTKNIFVTSNNNFIIGETIVGETSRSSSTISDYKPNIVSFIDNFIKYKDIDSTIDSLFQEYKKIYLNDYPNESFGTGNQKLVIKNIKEINSTKGTVESNRLFFNAFYNTQADTTFTNERLLKNSHGDWKYDLVLRVTGDNVDNFKNCVGRKIYSLNNNNEEIASAYIAEAITLLQSNIPVVELKLEKNIYGSFEDDSIIYCVDPVEDILLTAEIKNIIKSISVNETGSYYNVNDPIVVEDIGTTLATAVISEVGFGKIDELIILDGGNNYKPGDIIRDQNKLNFTDKFYERYVDGYVAVVGGSLLLESSGDSILLDENDIDSILSEDSGYILHEISSRINEKLLLMDDGDIIFEDSGSITDSPDTVGEITKVVLNNTGNGYNSLPTVIVDSVNGSGANIIGVSTQDPKIGHIKNVNIDSNGFDYPSVPDIYTYTKLIVKLQSQTPFLIGDVLTSHSGTVVSHDNTTGILVLDSSDTFLKNESITTNTNAKAIVLQNETADISVTLGNLSVTPGEYISEKGKLSNNSMRIQDSLYFQDFAYEIKTEIPINTWRNLLKQTIHPAGWNVFGSILLDNFVSGNSVATLTKLQRGLFRSTFAPILLTKIGGRRLGTVLQGQLNDDDNVAKFGNPNRVRYDNIIHENGYDTIVFEEGGIILFEKYNREVTLSLEIFVSPHKIDSKLPKRYSPVYKLQKYSFNSSTRNAVPSTTLDGTAYPKTIVPNEYFTIDQLSNYKIEELPISLGIDYLGQQYNPISYNGYVDVIERNTTSTRNNNDDFGTSYNIPPPGEIYIIDKR